MTTLGSTELARRVLVILDNLSSGLEALGSSGSTVDAIFSWLDREDLTTDELAEVLQQLRRAGRLGKFLNLVSNRRMRDYLRKKGVPWAFVLQNWEPAINDSGTFFAGFLIGAAENVVEVIRLVAVIAGSPFSEELAKERDKFWDAVRFLISPEFFGLIRQFAASPAAYARAGLDRLKTDIEDKLWNLEFFEAGRLLGSLTVTVLLILESLRKLPALLNMVKSVAANLTEMTVDQLKRLGVSLERIREFAQSSLPQLVTPEGFVLADAGNDVVIVDRAGTPVGKVVRSKALQQAATTGSILKGFGSLTVAARSWLAKYDNFLGLARRFLIASLPDVDEIVDAINRFQGCTNFERVMGNYLRGLAGSGTLARNSSQGASFVLRWALANLKDVDPRLIIFEARAWAGSPTLRGPETVRSAFIRFTDIFIAGGRKIELKSVTDLTNTAMKGAVKQLSRDIVQNADNLERIQWVFDTTVLRVSPQQVLTDIKAAVISQAKFKSVGQFNAWADKLDDALNRIITFWP